MNDDAYRQPDVLARRPGLRLLAVTLWAGFLGAVPMLGLFLFTLPSAWAELLAIDALSKMFLLCWLLALLPAVVAGVLTARGIRGVDHEH